MIFPKMSFKNKNNCRSKTKAETISINNTTTPPNIINKIGIYD